MKNFLYNFWKNLVTCFSGKNIFWHFFAIGITYVLVISGFDWFYFEFTRNMLLQQLALLPAILGFIVPVALPIGIYIISKRKGNYKNYVVTEGVIQAGLIAYLISITYKTFTGRIQPEWLTNNSTIDISREFHFGFLQHGVIWGWPSGHTAVAFAMSFVLIRLYPKSKKVIYLSLIYAFFIGLGVSVSIHWFSDFVAGAIIGSLVGIVVGGNFLNLKVRK